MSLDKKIKAHHKKECSVFNCKNCRSTLYVKFHKVCEEHLFDFEQSNLPDNIDLYIYLKSLESRIEYLEKEIKR